MNPHSLLLIDSSNLNFDVPDSIRVVAVDQDTTGAQSVRLHLEPAYEFVVCIDQLSSFRNHPLHLVVLHLQDVLQDVLDPRPAVDHDRIKSEQLVDELGPLIAEAVPATENCAVD